MSIIQAALTHFKHDWKHNRRIFWMEAYAILSAMIASSAVAIMTSNSPWPIIYFFFLSSSSLSIITGNFRKSGAQIVLSSFFTIVNSIGLINSIFFI